MLNVYATPHYVHQYLLSQDTLQQIETKLNPRDEDLIKRFTIQASRRFDTECKRSFYPKLETRLFDHPIDNTRLLLDDDLLSVSTFTTNNGNTTVASSNYFLMAGESYNELPYDRIALKSDGTRPSLLFSNTIQQANSVNGHWGYHERWADAWLDSGDTVQDNPLSDSATNLTVGNADGEDYYGLVPRFQVYQLLKIEDEYLTITALDGNTLTVKRGVNGTMAAAHIMTTSIEVYQPMIEVQEALTILASYAYKRKDAIGSPTDRSFTAPSGVFVMPAKLPDEVLSMIKSFKSVR